MEANTFKNSSIYQGRQERKKFSIVENYISLEANTICFQRNIILNNRKLLSFLSSLGYRRIFKWTEYQGILSEKYTCLFYNVFQVLKVLLNMAKWVKVLWLEWEGYWFKTVTDIIFCHSGRFFALSSPYGPKKSKFSKKWKKYLKILLC